MKPAIVAAIVLTALVYLPPRSECQQNAGQSQQQSDFNPPRTAKNQEGAAIQGAATQQSPQWYKTPEWVLVIVGSVTALFICWQSYETRRAANISSRGGRAWIIDVGIDNPDLSDGWIPRAVCHFMVIGDSPVRAKDAEFRFRVVNGRPMRGCRDLEPDLPKKPDYRNTFSLSDSPEMGKVRPPGDTFMVVPRLDSLFFEKGDVAAIEAGEKFLCVYGFIRYEDGASGRKRRETRFCYVRGKTRTPIRDHPQPEFVAGGPPAYNGVT